MAFLGNRARRRDSQRWVVAGASLWASLVAMAGTARAQEATDFLGSDIPFDLTHTKGVAVAERPHPELDPVGVRAGTSWLFLPAVTTSLGFTNNVYGSKTDTVGDGFVTIAPRAQLVSQWSRHFLEFNADAGIKRFFSQGVRSETAWSVRGDGRYDLGTAGSNIFASGAYIRGFEAQYSGDFPQNAAGTVSYHQGEAIARGIFVLNRVRLTVNERLNDLNYDDTTARNGTLIKQSYRNRTEVHSSARIEYAFDNDTAAFSEVSYSTADYHVASAAQPLRSNNEVRVLAGARVDVHHLIRAMVGVGYARRSYDLASTYRPLKGLTLDARVQWLLTELTTVNVEASRKIQDSVTQNSSGYFETTARVRIDHELLRNALLFAEGTYQYDRFASITRRDKQWQGRGGAVWSLSRHLKVSPSVWYITRSSKGLPIGQEFNEVRGTVDLFAQW